MTVIPPLTRDGGQAQHNQMPFPICNSGRQIILLLKRCARPRQTLDALENFVKSLVLEPMNLARYTPLPEGVDGATLVRSVNNGASERSSVLLESTAHSVLEGNLSCWF